MKHILILILVFAANLSVFSQGEKITSEEYWQPRREALKKGRSIDRRVTSKTENYEDGKSISTSTWLYEYLLPDRIRYVNVESRDGKEWRKEQIDIGEMKYCKRDNAEWTVSNRDCIGGGIGGHGKPISESYTLEKVMVDGQSLTRYHYYVTHKGWAKDDKRTWFSESTYWLDGDERIVKQESRRGISDPFTVTGKTQETYEYEPKDLKIEAPIKL